MRSIAKKPRRRVNPSKALFEPKKKKKTIAQLKKKAWEWFSWYVRLRECNKTTGTLTEGVCYTCGRRISIKQMQAGHFLPGRRAAVLFDPDQVRGQCFSCNIWGHGQWPEYFDHMVKDWGYPRVQQMMIERHKCHKWTSEELEKIADTYREKVKNLSKE